MMLTAISGAAHIPTTKGSTGRRGMPRSRSCSMVELLEAIRAGNITETRLIRTIVTVKMKIIHLTRFVFLLDTLFSDEFELSTPGLSLFFMKFFLN